MIKNWLGKDPFKNFRVKHVDPKIPHLPSEELETIEEIKITLGRLALLRDMFLSSCYTGFAYIDTANLTIHHLKARVDGKKWLIKPRQKTGISKRVPLIPPALTILKKHKNY